MSVSSTRTAREPRDTPAMRQYRRFKEQHPDCVLLFRMGDFYELFDEDAVTVSRAINLTLTQRTAGIPMAGIPYHAVDTYLRKLIEQGFRVAVCDQIQDPREAKGVVDRAVTRVLTPGTLIDENLLDDSASNLIAAVQFTESGDDSAAVLAIAELSTGRFTLHDLPRGRIVDELARLNPTELIHVETADSTTPRRIELVRERLGCALTARPGWTFRMEEARELLCRHFGVSTLSGFGLDEHDEAIGPAGALLHYLQETQSPDDLESKSRLAHLRPPKREAADDYLTIDAASLHSLEIERTMRSGRTDGSLLGTIQRCRTSMGKRLLRTWLCFPLRSRKKIEARQRCVRTLLDSNDLARSLDDELSGMQDVARIAGRIAMSRATPRDLVALGRSVVRIERVGTSLDDHESFAMLANRLHTLAEQLMPLATTIGEQCSDEPPAHMREGGLFRDGVDAQLDEARSLQRDANSWLAAYQKQLIEETDIPSLKVGYNKVFGYYIEITNAHRDKTPETFNRKQTLKNAERYITPELKEFEDKVTTAETRAIEREKVLFERLCKQAAGLAGPLAEYAELVAAIDVLLNFAEIAKRFGYVQPTLVDEPVLVIKEGRHPVLDRTLGERFVPNDCVLGKDAGTKGLRDEVNERTDAHPADVDDETGTTQQSDATASLSPFVPQSLALITGPNMAGKSTYIRQVALITLLAHTGSFVPAAEATIGMTDRIFTRIGASDELHAGQSTFMVEMTEAANILHHATEHSLVILDEIGRGTSTLDGLSLAWAIAESLAASRCRTLFATHYHELTALADRIDGVMNLHVAVREWGAPGNEEIIFVHRIQPGRTDRSYGIHVAKIAGLPPRTIARAQELLETLAVQEEETSRVSAKSDGAPPQKHEPQMSLFTEYLDHPAIDELKALDLEKLTPLEAFDALRKLKERLDDQAK